MTSKIIIKTGRMRDYELDVVKLDEKGVKAKVPEDFGGGTITLPKKNKITNMEYYEELRPTGNPDADKILARIHGAKKSPGKPKRGSGKGR